MYVCVLVSIYCICARISARLYACVLCNPLHVCAVCVCVSMYACMCAYMCACMCVYVCMYVCMYVRMYVCMYVIVCMDVCIDGTLYWRCISLLNVESHDVTITVLPQFNRLSTTWPPIFTVRVYLSVF